MSNEEIEKEEMKDETHKLEDREQDEKDQENEFDTEYLYRQMNFESSISRLISKANISFMHFNNNTIANA